MLAETTPIQVTVGSPHCQRIYGRGRTLIKARAISSPFYSLLAMIAVSGLVELALDNLWLAFSNCPALFCAFLLFASHSPETSLEKTFGIILLATLVFQLTLSEKTGSAHLFFFAQQV